MADGPPGGKKTTKRKGMKLGAAIRHGDEESGNASFEKEPLIEKRQLGNEATWGDDEWNDDNGNWGTEKKSVQSVIAQPTYTRVSPRHSNRQGMKRMAVYITRSRLALGTVMAIFVIFGLAFSIGGTRHSSTAVLVEQQQQQQQDISAFYGADGTGEIPVDDSFGDDPSGSIDHLNTMLPENPTVIDVIPEYSPSNAPPLPRESAIQGTFFNQDSWEQGGQDKEQKWGISQQELSQDADDYDADVTGEEGSDASSWVQRHDDYEQEAGLQETQVDPYNNKSASTGTVFDKYSKDGEPSGSEKVVSDDYSSVYDSSVSIFPSEDSDDLDSNDVDSEKFAGQGWDGEDLVGSLQQEEDLEVSNDYDAYEDFAQDDGSFSIQYDDENAQALQSSGAYDDYEPQFHTFDQTEDAVVSKDDDYSGFERMESSVPSSLPQVPLIPKTQPRRNTDNDYDDQELQYGSEEPEEPASQFESFSPDKGVQSTENTKNATGFVSEAKTSPIINSKTKNKLNSTSSFQPKLQTPARGEGMHRTKGGVGQLPTTKAVDQVLVKNPPVSLATTGNMTEKSQSKLETKKQTMQNGPIAQDPYVGLNGSQVQTQEEFQTRSKLPAGSQTMEIRKNSTMLVARGNSTTAIRTNVSSVPVVVVTNTTTVGGRLGGSLNVSKAPMTDSGSLREGVVPIKGFAKQMEIAAPTQGGSTKTVQQGTFRTTPHLRSEKLEDDTGYVAGGVSLSKAAQGPRAAIHAFGDSPDQQSSQPSQPGPHLRKRDGSIQAGEGNRRRKLFFRSFF